MIKATISGFYDETGSDLKNQLKIMQHLGENYMCPRNIGKKNIADFTVEEFAKDVKPILDANNVKFSSIGSPIGKVGINDDSGIAKQKKQLKELIGIAELMGCKYIRIFSFFVKPADYASARDKVIKTLKEFIDMTEGTNVTLLHENEKGIYGATDTNCLDLYKALACDHFKLIYDASNFIQCDVDPAKAFDLLKDYVVYYHIKDCDKETKVEVPVGSGDGQYKRMFKELAERNFEGFMTLEPHTFKYAVLKPIVNFVPFARFMPKLKNCYKAFKKIDKFMGRKFFMTAGVEEMFGLQYNLLKQLIGEVNNG